MLPHELTLLVVDDQPDNLITLSALIGESFPSARVLTASSGAQGIELAASSDADAILLDVVMRGMDGFEICRRLKADAATRDIPVAFVTAMRASRDDRIKALEMGAEGFLCKPVDDAELITLIGAMGKIRTARRYRRDEAGWLSDLVDARTGELASARDVALVLIEELRRENSARRASEERLERALRSLRESEETYRTLFREMLNGFAVHEIVLDGAGVPADYRFLAVNPAFERMTGIEAANIVGKTALEVLPGLESGWIETYGAVVTTGEPAHFVRRADSLRKTFEVTAFRVAPGQFACNFLDMTERLNAEARLRSSEEFLTNIVNAIADPVFVKDDQFRFTLANAAMGEVLGVPAKELIGITGADFLVVEELKHFRAVDRAVLESGEPNVSEEQLTSADGVTRTVITKKARYVDPVGARFIVGVSRDVTEFKLMQAQIAQSDRLASVGMLAAGVAHEINNPLAYVLYNLESLTEELPRLVEVLGQCSKTITGALGGEAWSALVGASEELFSSDGLEDLIARFQDALSGTNRIKAVARGLGTFSRVEDTTLAPVDVIQIVEVAVNMVFNEIKYRARLIKEYNDVSLVMASDGRLSQVFLNLLINASHAIRDGDFDQNEIRVRTFEDSGEVCVEVGDTGTGIPESHMARLFEPFFTTKARGVGTGLGLSISRDIVEGYGGRIEVTSELGVGTRFVVRLPAIPVEPAPDEAVFDEADEEGTVHGRVLVVDDDAAMRAALGRILSLHEVVGAQSGDEARMLLQVDQAFDLILCDVMMPVVSGVDLHAWLATAHPELAERVVFVTGGAFTSRAQEYLSQHANIQVEKPFAPAAIAAIADELTRLSQRRSRDVV